MRTLAWMWLGLAGCVGPSIIEVSGGFFDSGLPGGGVRDTGDACRMPSLRLVQRPSGVDPFAPVPVHATVALELRVTADGDLKALDWRGVRLLMDRFGTVTSASVDAVPGADGLVVRVVPAMPLIAETTYTLDVPWTSGDEQLCDGEVAFAIAVEAAADATVPAAGAWVFADADGADLHGQFLVRLLAGDAPARALRLRFEDEGTALAMEMAARVSGWPVLACDPADLLTTSTEDGRVLGRADAVPVDGPGGRTLRGVEVVLGPSAGGGVDGVGVRAELEADPSTCAAAAAFAVPCGPCAHDPAATCLAIDSRDVPMSPLPRPDAEAVACTP